MIELVVFLGNYGKDYAKTRHNVGWLFADSLPFANKLSWQNKFKGEIASCTPQELAQWACDTGVLATKDGSPARVPDEAPAHIYFLKPLTLMNLSGDSIIEVANFYKIKPENILVIHDDLEMEPGFVNFKYAGGLGGHNGLRSTKAVLGTENFYRIKIGIGRPDHKDIAAYVLSNFTADEQIILSQVFAQMATIFTKQLLATDPQRFLQKKNLKA